MNCGLCCKAIKMSNTYVVDALKRLVAIQKEIPTTPLANNAVPQAFYTQNAMPYWTNRTVGFRLTPGRSQDYRAYRYRFGMTYVRAFLTEGVQDSNGNAETLLYTDIPIISDWLGGTIQLQSAAFPTQMQFLDPEGAYLTDMTVYLGQMHSGIGQKIIGADFVIEVPLTVPTPLRY
jgi:hypothetical protein